VGKRKITKPTLPHLSDALERILVSSTVIINLVLSFCNDNPQYWTQTGFIPTLETSPRVTDADSQVGDQEMCPGMKCLFVPGLLHSEDPGGLPLPFMIKKFGSLLLVSPRVGNQTLCPGFVTSQHRCPYYSGSLVFMLQHNFILLFLFAKDPK